MCYAYSSAFDIIVRYKEFLAKQAMSEFLAPGRLNPLTSALHGCIFKSDAIELLEKGGAFTCRNLIPGSTDGKPGLVIP